MSDRDDEHAGPSRAVPPTERQIAAHVDALAAQGCAEELASLLDERHPFYTNRSTAVAVRIRGWILCALARGGLSARHLVYALEELDNGRDPYLVAAAARALRSHPHPRPELAPYLAKAVSNIRFHDDALELEQYGGYAIGRVSTTAFREVIETIAWLARHGQALAPLLRELAGERSKELSVADREAVARALAAVSPEEGTGASDCCGAGADFLRGLQAFKEWRPRERRPAEGLQSVVFEDHSGRRLDYASFFRGVPSIVVFFYTRCDNPEKCSLTVAKLGNVVRLLGERGLSTRVRTAAISYDPAWDVPERLAGYAKSRNLPMSDEHRLLRTLDGESVLRAHFGLGVNFIESLVNRHRVELFLLDASGRVAASFERLQWNEQLVVEQIASLLPPGSSDPPSSARAGVPRVAKAVTGPLLALVTAFFPKCPLCWAAYSSVFGLVGLDALPYSPWLLPLFAALLLIHLVSVRWRSASHWNRLPFWLSAAGAALILVLGLGLEYPLAAPVGVGLSLLGALASVFGGVTSLRPA